VDGVGKIAAKDHQQRSWLMQIRIPETLSRYTIEKGSVAVDGISLTINRCGSRSFEVNVIPQTGRETTLLKKSPGDLVNIETDLIGKYVERFLSRDKREETGRALSRGIDREMLLRQGFGE
jgi:riboflavin synthase